ncbi:5903_t:CDS:1, partial [Funneliformis geosporum]
MSLASAARKIDSDGEGHRPDFMFTIDLNGHIKFEIVFGLYYPSSKFTMDLVDLGVLMKDSLDNIYNKGVELEMVVFGIHSFGIYCKLILPNYFPLNLMIYESKSITINLYWQGIILEFMQWICRMIAYTGYFLLREFELPRSNISLGLVEFVLYEIVNLK